MRLLEAVSDSSVGYPKSRTGQMAFEHTGYELGRLGGPSACQGFVNRVKPERDELLALLSEDTRDIDDNLPDLGTWIAGNAGFALPRESQNTTN
jgi:hypothetical protein